MNNHHSSNDLDKSDDVSQASKQNQEEKDATPKVSTFEDSKVDTQDIEKDDDGSNLGVVLVAGFLGGVGGSYFVRRKRSKKKMI